MYDSILVFGDSHLDGLELDVSPVARKEKTWPAIVGKRLGIAVHNFALRGGSNDRSLRMLPSKLLQFRNSLVIYGITHFNRQEIFQKGKGYVPVGVCWTQNDLYEHRDVNDHFMSYMLPNTLDEMEDNNLRVLNHLLQVQALCKCYAADHMLMPLFNLELIEGKQQQLLVAIENLYQFPNSTSWMNWCNRNDFPRGSMHYLQPAHDAFAEIIYEEITKRIHK
jgi:hypothetical protein